MQIAKGYNKGTATQFIGKTHLLHVALECTILYKTRRMRDLCE